MLAKNEIIASRYRIAKKLGEGGMQYVHLAQDLVLQRDIVVKEPKTTSAHKRFSDSAKMSAKVVHPNVAGTLDYIPGEKCDFLVEEYINGSDLGDRLREFDLLDPHLATHIAHHIARGIAASHHAGVFHRDLKPSNIMVSNDPGFGLVKVTDFGIAKMAEDEFDQALAETSVGSVQESNSTTLIGALPYMAPELIEDHKSAWLPADIWAVGSIFYEMLFGVRPFPKLSDKFTKDVHRREEKLPNRLQFKTLIDEAWEIIQKCLRRDPASRLSADELVSEFAKICYSNAERINAVVDKARLNNKAYGFLTAKGYPQIFFHEESFYGNRPEVGMRVNCACFIGDPQVRAFPVVPLKKS